MSANGRQLFGSAMSVWLPPAAVDISDLRQVPDHQEVFGHESTDQSIVIEILEYVNEPDKEAVRFHFKDIAESNNAGGELSEVCSVEPLMNVSLTQCKSAWILTGQQLVGKFTDMAKNKVQVYMAVFRLHQYATDIVVSFNDPVYISPQSSSHTGKPESNRWTIEDFIKVATSLRLVDASLFGS